MIMEAFALRTDILGVGFDDLTLEEAVARGTAFLEEDRFHYVVTPNPELVDRPAGRGPSGRPSTEPIWCFRTVSA